MPTFCLAMSVVWTFFFLLIALLMSTGLADEPGDTNGLLRFAKIFTIFVAPGIVAMVFSIRAVRRRDAAQRHGARGFPVQPTHEKQATEE